MSRYVDIEGDWVDDAVKAYSLGYYEDDEYAIPIERFDSAPSIDLVTCAECRCRNENCGMGEHKWCEKLNMSTTPNDFCSWAERRTDE